MRFIKKKQDWLCANVLRGQNKKNLFLKKHLTTYLYIKSSDVFYIYKRIGKRKRGKKIKGTCHVDSTATSVKLHEKQLLDGQDIKLEDYNFWYSSSGLEVFFFPMPFQ